MRKIVVVFMEPVASAWHLVGIVILAFAIGACVWLVQWGNYILSGKTSVTPPTRIASIYGYQPYFSSDGHKILFEKDYLVMSIYLDGTHLVETKTNLDSFRNKVGVNKVTCLSSNLPTQNGMLFIMSGDSWNQIGVSPECSPNNELVAYINNDPFSHRSEVWIMDSNGSNPQLITALKWIKGPVRWSPNSKKIVFAGGEGGDDVGIFIVDLTK